MKFILMYRKYYNTDTVWTFSLWFFFKFYILVTISAVSLRLEGGFFFISKRRTHFHQGALWFSYHSYFDPAAANLQSPLEFRGGDLLWYIIVYVCRNTSRFHNVFLFFCTPFFFPSTYPRIYLEKQTVRNTVDSDPYIIYHGGLVKGVDRESIIKRQTCDNLDKSRISTHKR